LAPWAGIVPEAAAEVASALAEWVDMITVVRGSIFTVSATRPDGHVTPGFNLDLARRLRVALPERVAVVAQGSIVDPSQAAWAVDDGVCDAVEMTRAQIADPDLAAKLASGAVGRQRLALIADWLESECRQRGVSIETGRAVGADEVEQFDGAVVLCTGSVAGRRTYEVEAGATVVPARSVLDGEALPDGRVAVTGEPRTLDAAALVDAGYRLPDDRLWRETGGRQPRAGDAVAPRTGEFAAVMLVSGDGGNAEPLQRAVATLQAEGRRVAAWSPQAEMLPQGLAGPAGPAGIADAHAGPAGIADAQAGRLETSMLLALAPATVRLDCAEAGDVRPLRELQPLLRAGGVRAVSPNGVLGDPAGASAAEGEAVLDALVACLVAAVDALGAPSDARG
jgi:Creatinine amidohydrolase/NADH:flavin oxidoreductase / NADH oxidase family